MSRWIHGTVAAVLIATASLAIGARMPDTWDGLVKVDAEKFDYAYLAPGTDFSLYQRVMLDPTEVAFAKNWQRSYNANARGSNRITDEEALEALQIIQEGFQEVFLKAYQDAGYQVVTTPGPDVLRVRSAVLNISVSAPEMDVGRSRTYSEEAGAATLVVEVRDSMSNALLGRGIDSREIGDSAFMMQRTSVSNRSDFARAFKSWAEMSASAITILRGLPPVSE